MSQAVSPNREQKIVREGLLARIVRAVSRRVWDVEIEELPRARRGPIRLARVAYLAARGFNAHQCLLRACALTYVTVLSLVPLLAFSFSVLKGFGFYDRFIQTTVAPFLEKTFGVADPGSAAKVGTQGALQLREAIDHVLEFVAHTDVASLGVVGLLLLMLTVVRLLGSIEQAFNHIWHVRRSRRWVRKVADYLAIVTITPIFFLAATALTTAAQDNGFVTFLRESLHLGPFINLALGLAPLLSMWIGFIFVYLALPNVRTPLASAAAGGFVAAALWQLTLVVYLKFQLGIASYNAIYASFAAIPIFLVWVNMSWVSVMIGAEVCAAHWTEPTYGRMPHSRSHAAAFRERLALRVVTRIGESFLRGGVPWTAARLSQSLRVPVHDLDGVLAALVEQKILLATGPENDVAFVPARALDVIHVKEILDALRGEHAIAELVPKSAYDQPADRLLDALAAELQSSQHNVTVRELSEAVMRASSVDEAEAMLAAAAAGSHAHGDDEPVMRTASHAS